MTKATIVGGAFATVLLLVGVAAGYRALKHPAAVPPSTPSTSIATTAAAERHPATEIDQGFLYGRITTVDGATYEGRLRWGKGGNQEAFWGDYFNGSKRENPWLAQVPPELRPKEHSVFEIAGFKIAERDSAIDVRRQLVTPFGEIARIEANGRDVQVTLKSGTTFKVDRFEASDLDDGVRVWDGRQGVVDLDSLRIRTIELLPTPSIDAAPSRLQGTVRTRRGEFTGFVEWDREQCLGTDELEGYTSEAKRRARFDAIRSIALRSPEGFLATLLDGSEIKLEDANFRGVHIEDRRYGRVGISWDAFERVDFSTGGSGPAYDDFPPGRPLTGSVTTRAGARLTGRLVYDLDESETTESLDSESHGVDYSIPFGLVASIVPRGHEKPAAESARVTLQSGEELELERTGDLGEQNAGVLVFVEGRPKPEYVPWTEVDQVTFDRR